MRRFTAVLLAAAVWLTASTAERLAAVKLALSLGNDINAHAGFGDFPIEGGGQELLLNASEVVRARAANFDRDEAPAASSSQP
jgi:hypothetical protein